MIFEPTFEPSGGMNASRAPTYAVSRVQCDETHGDADACRYAVRWKINPHMRVGGVNFEAAHRQHARFVSVLTAHGAELVELPFIHGAHDCVFTKDFGLLVRCAARSRLLLANPRFGVRRREQDARAEQLEVLGYEVASPPRACWEGGDVSVLEDGRVLFGYGQRSHRQAARWFEEQLNDESRSSCAILTAITWTSRSPSPDRTVLVCPDALTPLSLRRLRSIPGLGEIVLVRREEAARFALNVVTIGDVVLLGARAPGVESVLRARGFHPVVVPLGEFQLAGGSAACLVARLHDVDGGASSRAA